MGRILNIINGFKHLKDYESLEHLEPGQKIAISSQDNQVYISPGNNTTVAGTIQQGASRAFEYYWYGDSADFSSTVTRLGDIATEADRIINEVQEAVKKLETLDEMDEALGPIFRFRTILETAEKGLVNLTKSYTDLEQKKKLEDKIVQHRALIGKIDAEISTLSKNLFIRSMANLLQKGEALKEVEEIPKKEFDQIKTQEREVIVDKRPIIVKIPDDILKRIGAFHYYFDNELEKGSNSTDSKEHLTSCQTFLNDLQKFLYKRIKDRDIRGALIDEFAQLASETLKAATIDGLAPAFGRAALDSSPYFTPSPIQTPTPFRFTVQKGHQLVVEGFLPYRLRSTQEHLQEMEVEGVPQYGCIKQTVTFDLSYFQVGRLILNATTEQTDFATSLSELWERNKIPGKYPLNLDDWTELDSTFSEPAQSAADQYYFGWVGSSLSSAYNTTLSKAKDYFVEYNHPWKQRKYKVCLDSVKQAIPNLEELQKKYNSPDASPLQQLSAQTLRGLTDQSTDDRSRANLFLGALRTALTSSEFDSEWKKKLDGKPYDDAVDLLLRISEARFTEVHPFTFLDYLVTIMIQSGVETNRKLQRALTERGPLPEDFTAISQAPREFKATQAGIAFGKIKGETGIYFDPHMGTNPPYVNCDIPMVQLNESVKPVRMIRTGTPTMEGVTGEPQVVPEFRAYIQSLELKKKKHLYVSLQNDNPQTIGNEKARNRAIRSLQEQHPGAFRMVVLAQDTDFYKRKGKFAQDSIGHDLFKKQLLEEMQKEGSGYSFPQEWLDDSKFKEQLSLTYDRVKETFFPDQTELSLQESKDFIELYDAFLTFYMIQYSGADSANISCKDAIDRGGKNNAILLYLTMILQGKGESDEHLHDLKVLTHAPAIWVKKQAIIESRRDRLITVLERLKDPEIQKRIRNLGNRLGVDPHSALAIQKHPEHLPLQINPR